MRAQCQARNLTRFKQRLCIFIEKIDASACAR